MTEVVVQIKPEGDSCTGCKFFIPMFGNCKIFERTDADAKRRGKDPDARLLACIHAEIKELGH